MRALASDEETARIWALGREKPRSQPGDLPPRCGCVEAQSCRPLVVRPNGVKGKASPQHEAVFARASLRGSLDTLRFVSRAPALNTEQ